MAKAKDVRYARLVLTETKEVVAQSVVVNGQEQNVMANVTILTCPNCHKPIFTFGKEVNGAEVGKWCTEHYNELTENSAYCSKCGQKLDYPCNIDIDC